MSPETREKSAKTAPGYRGLAMEGPIAAWYARITSKDSRRHAGLADRLASRVPPEGSVLEVAPGPGYFAIELAKRVDAWIVSLDISVSFVEMARRNAARSGVGVDFRHGNASAMPFADATFDLVVCQAAFKNFSEPERAIAEMHCVLKPGGLALVVDLRRDAPAEEIEREVRGMAMGRLNTAVTRWTFRRVLLKRAYSVAEMEAMARRSPFAGTKIEVRGISFHAWLSR